MRNIGFRAWHTVQKKMGRVTLLDFYHEVVATDTFTGTPQDTVLMQSIARKDDYGVIMFEGDIITATVTNEFGSRSIERATIIYDENLYKFRFIYRNMLPLTSVVSIKVIGNKYENPNLYKKYFDGLQLGHSERKDVSNKIQ